MADAVALSHVCQEMRCICRGINDPLFRPYQVLLAERDRLIARMIEISEGDGLSIFEPRKAETALRKHDNRANVGAEVGMLGWPE